MNLPVLSISHAVQGLHTRVTADGDARIDRLDVAGFGKDLELNVSIGQRASPVRREASRAERSATWAGSRSR
jgi:hypothetical protein